jgi:CRP-like cAMP-binding protein
MSPQDFAALATDMKRVAFGRDLVLAMPDEAPEHIYFPESGVASIVLDLPETGPTEVGLFGREGMSSTHILLGADTSSNKTFVQIAGASAIRIGAEALQAAVAKSQTLQILLLRYTQTMMIQIAHGAVANAHHRMEARLARWLLMCHDRVEGDELHLTHDFMAMMIAVQRTGVTITLHILEGGGSIRSKRGKVVILDRERLEELAGDAYGYPEAEYRRLICPFVSINLD